VREAWVLSPDRVAAMVLYSGAAKLRIECQRRHMDKIDFQAFMREHFVCVQGTAPERRIHIVERVASLPASLT
jgi:hypothetical protein